MRRERFIPCFASSTKEVGFENGTAPDHDLTPCIISVIAHIYLVIVGAQLVLHRRIHLLGWFFALESAYAVLLMLMLPLSVRRGLISTADAEWSACVSMGFYVQLGLLFPLWGWLLSRNYQPTT